MLARACSFAMARLRRACHAAPIIVISSMTSVGAQLPARPDRDFQAFRFFRSSRLSRAERSSFWPRSRIGCGGPTKGPLLWALLLVPFLSAGAGAKKPKPLAPVEVAQQGAGRSPAAWPFSASSPWNTPLGSGVELEPTTGACSQSFRAAGESDINAAEWSHPVYLAKKSDPLVRLYVYGELKATLRVPRAAEPARPRNGDTDGHLHIIDPTEHFVDELFHARRRADGHLTAEAYSRNDLRSSGVGQGGVRAYGGSAIAGLIRRGELAAGLRHVLALAVPRRAQRIGPVWPATDQDDFAEAEYHGSIPMGQLVALPRDVDANALGLGREGRVLLRALQDYGAYDVDSAGDFSLYAEPSVETELGSARADWAKLRPLLRCVTNNRQDAIGGPGARVAPPAPLLPP